MSEESCCQAEEGVVKWVKRGSLLSTESRAISESRYHEYTRAAEALGFCLSSLGPVGVPALIHDTVQHFLRLHRTRRIGARFTAEFLNQCALLLYSALNLSLARDFECAARAFWDRIRPSNEEQALRLSRVAKRRAFISGAHVVGQAEAKGVVSLAEFAVLTARELKHLDALASALYVNGLMEFYGGYGGSIPSARRLIDEANEIRRKTVTVQAPDFAGHFRAVRVP